MEEERKVSLLCFSCFKIGPWKDMPYWDIFSRYITFVRLNPILTAARTKRSKFGTWEVMFTGCSLFYLDGSSYNLLLRILPSWEFPRIQHFSNILQNTHLGVIPSSCPYQPISPYPAPPRDLQLHLATYKKDEKEPAKVQGNETFNSNSWWQRVSAWSGEKETVKV